MDNKIRMSIVHNMMTQADHDRINMAIYNGSEYASVLVQDSVYKCIIKVKYGSVHYQLWERVGGRLLDSWSYMARLDDFIN